jgi:hypothetical protein
VSACTICGCRIYVFCLGLCSSCLRHLDEKDTDGWNGKEFRREMTEKIRAKIAAKALRGGDTTSPGDNVLSFPATIVGAKTSTSLSVQSTIYCVPRVLRVTEETAECFEILNIRVGNMLQIDQPVIAKFFAESFQSRFGNIPLRIDPIKPSINFTMGVANRTNTPHVFEAMWDVEEVR